MPTGLAMFCRLPLGADLVIMGMGFEGFALALYDTPERVEGLFDLYGTMNLTELKKRYGRRLCLCGHIDLNVLSSGTPEDLERLVREAIAGAAPGGGYIVGGVNSVASYCKPENVRAMERAIIRYGRYPIRIS